MAIIRRILIILGKALFIFVGIFIAALFLFDAFVQFRDTDKELETFFKDKGISGELEYYTNNNRRIRYMSVGNENQLSSILFIHGAPSSMSYFKKYLSDDTLLQRAFMMAVDRPGYGYSDFGHPEISIESQVKMIRPLLDSIYRIHHPLVVVGVSYGTSIACRLAMDYPNLVDGLVLVAPSLAPGEEKIYPVTYPIENLMIKWSIPRMLVSANAEKLSHEKELEKMLPCWENIKVPVIYLQGENDGLIYPSNAVFARKMLVNAGCLDIHMIPGRGHLIAFSEMERIKHAIVDMLELSKQHFQARRN